MIAVDTNILVHAHREDMPWHDVAAERLRALAESHESWGIPWPCAHEFFAKVTHPRIFVQPSSPDVALRFIHELTRAPGLRMLAETDTYWETLERLVHGVSELWTADRDFGRFPGLRSRNPLVE